MFLKIIDFNMEKSNFAQFFCTSSNWARTKKNQPALVTSTRFLAKERQTNVCFNAAGELSVTIEPILNYLKEIQKIKKLPHELNKNQKNLRFKVAFSLILRKNIDLFLDRIVTCNEKWILYDN